VAITGCSSMNQPVMKRPVAQTQAPIKLAQWSWGKNVDLKKKNSDPFVKQDEEQTAQAESEAEDAVENDVTVVDPDAKPEPDAPKTKEPRRLWGIGKNAAQPPEPSRDKEPQNSKPSSSWFTKTPSNSKSVSSTSNHSSVVVDEAEERHRKAQFDQAEALYKEGKLTEAEAVLKPLTKKKKNFWANLRIWSADPGTREEHNRVREDSLFLLAESYFKQERLSDAKENYEALLKDYPSTRHLNVSTRRLFVIGKTWLGMSDFATSSDITPVNVEDPRSTPQPKRQKPPHSTNRDLRSIRRAMLSKRSKRSGCTTHAARSPTMLSC
jgi:TolA-binding protein